MKKIVMFSGPQHEIPPTKGAAVQTWIDEVSKRIVKYQTHIISISNDFMPLKEVKEGVFYHRIKISKLYKRIFQKILGWDIYSYNRRVLSIINKIEPDIIHIHNYNQSVDLIRRIEKLNKKAKIILHAHNQIDSPKNSSRPKVNLFLGCSNFILKDFKENNKVSADKYRVIYNGVDVTKFSNQTKIKNKSDDKKINIFFFGRIAEEKGVDLFVKLASAFKDLNKFSFYCVGEISKKGDKENFYRQLQYLIKNQGINNLEFIDYISPQKIHLAYQLADFVVIPSRFEEPFCMVAIEAMASGIPTICTPKGGMVEYLKNNINSIVINDDILFVEHAKDAILNLVNNDSERISIIQAALNMVKNEFDWIKIAQAIEGIYFETLKNKTP